MIEDHNDFSWAIRLTSFEKHYLSLRIRTVVYHFYRILNVLTTNRFIRRAEEKKEHREISIGNNGDNNDRIFIVQSSWTIAERYSSKGARTRAFPRRKLQPFLIPSCGVLNSPLLLLQLFARTSRFSNYTRVAYLTGGICPSLLLCSFLRGPPSLPSAPHTPLS